MRLENYFEKVKGFGIPSIADSRGHVDAAAISRPSLFLETSGKYGGVRSHLTKTKESCDMGIIEKIGRERHPISAIRDDAASKLPSISMSRR